MEVLPKKPLTARDIKKRAYHKIWSAKNRESINQKSREKRAKHRAIWRIYWATMRRYNRLMKPEKTHQDDRRNYLQKKYGVTNQWYADTLKKQNGKCAICIKEQTRSTQTKRRGIRRKLLCVDHCHKTGKVRELLCHDCNTALGALHESIPTLKNMILYIQKHQ